MRKLPINLLAALLLVLSILAASCSADTASTDATPDPSSSPDAAGETVAEASEGSDYSATAGEGSADAGGGDEGASAPMADGGSAGGDRAASGSADGAVADSEGAVSDEAGASSASMSEPDAASPLDGENEDSTIIEELPPTTMVQPQPQSGLLTAADIDDNLNYDFFVDYMGRNSPSFGQYPSSDRNLAGRVVIKTVDANGSTLANARLVITNSDGASTTVFTNPTGNAYLFPYAAGIGDWDQLSIALTPADQISNAQSNGAKQFEINAQDLNADGVVTLKTSGQARTPEALDVALVIDTTGSMGDELAYLNTEFTSIVSQVKKSYPNVDMRFALITYRDQGDEYVTNVVDFSSDMAEIQQKLSVQYADGGGDFPEAMDQALIDATELSWRSGNVARVMVLNADAPPHDQGVSPAFKAVDSARELGVRIYPLAASGTDDGTEYVMRLMAAYTGGRYLFLTDDSGVGLTHQEPKAPCYVVTRLDQLLVRVLSTEVSGQRVEPTSNQIIRTVGDYQNGYCGPVQ